MDAGGWSCPQVVVVLPAFNEEANIGHLLARIHATAAHLGLPVRLVVVDDGSRDGTVSVVEGFCERLEIEIVRFDANRGLGEAVKTGIGRALAVTGDDDVIITMDADDSCGPGLFARMVERLREGYDIVIASRFVPQARIRGLSVVRRLYSSVASLVFRTFTPVQGVRDFTCGYRAYRAGFLRQVWARHGQTITTENGFTCMADILLKCRPFDPIVAELPLILRYDRKLSTSKMQVRRTIVESLRLIARTRLLDLEERLRGAGSAPQRHDQDAR